MQEIRFQSFRNSKIFRGSMPPFQGSMSRFPFSPPPHFKTRSQAPVLTAQTIPVIEWNSTMSQYKQTTCTEQLTKYQSLFVVDRFCTCLSVDRFIKVLCFSMSTFALFPFVFLCFMLFYVDIARSTGLMFHAFLCRQVLRLFISTCLLFSAFLCRYLRCFPCLHVDRFMQLWSNVFLCRDIQSLIYIL